MNTTWEDTARIVRSLLCSMYEDENGPPLSEQIRFFRDTSQACAVYADYISAILSDNAE